MPLPVVATFNIPGFYFDKAKNRYFKVQPSHLAPHGSKYSKDAVKLREKTETLQMEAHATERQIQRERLLRSTVLQHPLGGRLSLQREVGYHAHAVNNTMASWALGLVKEGFIEKHGHLNSVGCLISDDAIGGLIYTTPHTVAYTVPNRGPGFTSYGGRLTLFPLENQPSCLSLSPARVLMATDLGGSESACVHLIKLGLPEERSGLYPGYLPTGVRVCLSTNTGNTFWGSTAHPTSGDFALASTHGTFLIKASQATWTVSRGQKFRSEVITVDWLDTNTILNGLRNSTVKLWDARIGGPEGTRSRIQHPSSVTHIRSLNSRMVVVAGLKSHLCIYDMRFLRKTGFTKPYIDYPSYRKEAGQVGGGFDVCKGVIAASTDDGSVQLFDCERGNELQNPIKGYAQPIRCLTFIEGEDTRKPPRLFVGIGSNIDEWVW